MGLKSLRIMQLHLTPEKGDCYFLKLRTPVCSLPYGSSLRAKPKRTYRQKPKLAKKTKTLLKTTACPSGGSKWAKQP